MKENYKTFPVIIFLAFGTFWLLKWITPPNYEPPRFRGFGAVGGSSTFKAVSHRPSFDMASTKKHIKRSWNWLDALQQSREIFQEKMAEWTEKWKEIRGIIPGEWYNQALHDLDNSPLAQQTSEIGGLHVDEYYKNRDKLTDDQNELIRLIGVMNAERTVYEQERSATDKEAIAMYGYDP